MWNKEYPRAYQATYLIKRKFQASPECLEFRKAWKIPVQGFQDRKEFSLWSKSLIRDTKAYCQGAKYRQDQQQILKKRKHEYEGKITHLDFKLFAFEKWLLVPLHKFNYDIDQITKEFGQPIYWRSFIEQCLLYKDFEPFPVQRPLPEPKLHWNNFSQSYDLTIENVFADTTTKDFDKQEFTEKLKELQKKLPGYTEKQTRKKKGFVLGRGVLETDVKHPRLSDIQKYEEIFGEVTSEDFGEEERRRAKSIKQARYRYGKYIKKPRSR